jgi:hypothetical protein
MKRQLSLIGIAALLVALSGCPFKKKPPVPQQGQAPTVQPEPAPPPPPATVETQPPPLPQASMLSEIASQRNSARLDSTAKARLDEVAERLQHETDSRAVVVGFAEPREAKSASLAAQRAANARDYLKEKGIDSSRIETRTSSAGGMKAETWIVPPGASFSEPDTEVVSAPLVKPASPPRTAAAPPPQGQPASTAPPPTQTGRLIIQEGSAPNSQGQAGGALEDSSSHSRQSTEQLLKDTETNLNKINRPLSPDEQAMVAQIKEYMKQSREATNSSDAVRARNLALKARLLSDELVKH